MVSGITSEVEDTRQEVEYMEYTNDNDEGV